MADILLHRAPAVQLRTICAVLLATLILQLAVMLVGHPGSAVAHAAAGTGQAGSLASQSAGHHHGHAPAPLMQAPPDGSGDLATAELQPCAIDVAARLVPGVAGWIDGSGRAVLVVPAAPSPGYAQLVGSVAPPPDRLILYQVFLL